MTAIGLFIFLYFSIDKNESMFFYGDSPNSIIAVCFTFLPIQILLLVKGIPNAKIFLMDFSEGYCFTPPAKHIVIAYLACSLTRVSYSAYTNVASPFEATSKVFCRDEC